VVPRAVSWLRRAGERAVQVGTPQRAVSLLSEALDLLDGLAPDDALVDAGGSDGRVALLLARSEAYGELRDPVRSRDDAAAGRAVAEAAGDERAVVRATVALARAAVHGGTPDEVEAFLDDALGRAAANGDDECRAMALRVRGFAALLRNEPEAAVASLEPALELYGTSGDRRGRAWVLQNLSWAHFIGGRIDDAEALLHDSAALFAELGDRGGLGWALGLLAFTRFHSGYPEEAEAMAEKAFSGAEEGGDRWAAGMGLVLTANTRLWTGRAEAAVERARQALETFEAIDDDYGRVQARVPLGRALVTTGHVEEGFRVLEQAGDFLLPSRSPGFIAFSATGLLSAAVQVGDRERAAAALAVLHAGELSTDDLATVGAGEHLVSKALLEVQRGCPDAALDLLREVRMAAGARGEIGYTGAVTALALAAAGRVDDVVAAASAVEADERSSYLDRLWAGLATAAVAARRGDRVAVEAGFRELLARAEDTDDRVAQALIVLGWALALEAVGGARAADQRASSTTRFNALGLDPSGWAVALGQAVGLAPAESSPV
jgi:tetratricopeptide (TPR) repeat protein